MRFTTATRVLLAAVILMLGGCVSAPPEIPYERASAGKIEKIGILTPSFPDGPFVVLASSVGQSFGLVGALVDAGMRASRESQFETLLAHKAFSVQETFSQTLTTALEAKGYAVIPIAVKREHSDFLAHYPPTADTNVDAYLDIVTQAYGYVAAGIGSSTPYRPIFMIRIKLIRAKDSSVLMQDVVMYNPIGNVVAEVTISPDQEYQFNNFDALMADPDHAVKGLQVAIGKSADMVGTLLK